MGRGVDAPHIRFPREGEEPDLRSAHGRLALIWIPTFAGKVVVKEGILVLRRVHDKDE